jgi:hypothetical protein
VHYINTADKAKMLIVGGHWDMDNAGYASPYVLENLERLKYAKAKKRAFLKIDTLPKEHDKQV